jgi:hypothetical protein
MSGFVRCKSARQLALLSQFNDTIRKVVLLRAGLELNIAPTDLAADEKSSAQPIAKAIHSMLIAQAIRRPRIRQAGIVAVTPASGQHQAGMSVSAANASGRERQAARAPDPIPIVAAPATNIRLKSGVRAVQKYESHIEKCETARSVRRGVASNFSVFSVLAIPSE